MTLNGYFASDFEKSDNPTVTIQQRLASALSSVGTRRTLAGFSLPSDKGTVEVKKAYVADLGGSAISNFSLLVRDDTNGNVIHSETSATLQEGNPLSSGGSSGTTVTVEFKNDKTNSDVFAANGMVALSLK